MKRMYFEKKGFKSFHQAFVEKKRIRKESNVLCKVVENGNGTYNLSTTSIHDNSQNYLKENGFTVLKEEAM